MPASFSWSFLRFSPSTLHFKKKQNDEGCLCKGCLCSVSPWRVLELGSQLLVEPSGLLTKYLSLQNKKNERLFETGVLRKGVPFHVIQSALAKLLPTRSIAVLLALCQPCGHATNQTLQVAMLLSRAFASFRLMQNTDKNTITN